jgi:hypothetical protein
LRGCCRSTGLCWEATRAPERCRRQVPFAQSQPTRSAKPVDGPKRKIPGVWGLAPSIPPKSSPKSVSVFQDLSTGQTLSPV